MNCREAQENLVECFDCEPSPALRAHLAACNGCAREYAAFQISAAIIARSTAVQASPGFKERVMNEIANTSAQAPSRRFMHRFTLPRLALAGTAAFLVLMAAPLFTTSGKQQALQLMAQSVQSMAGVDSVHITARMRTLPRENFEYINPQEDWVPLEIWKQFGNMPRWRVEKPGRVAAMDGTSSVLFMKPDRAVRGGVRTGFLDWLDMLLDTGAVMDTEMRSARAGTSSLKVARAGTTEVVTVTRKAQGEFTNDWLRNKGITSADQTRIYRFDAATHRLAAMQIVLHANGKDTPVFEITGMRYNDALDPALFTVALPENVNWSVDAADMPVTETLPRNAKEAAKLLFESLAASDWKRARMVIPDSRVADTYGQAYGGLKLISLGEPFQSGLYPGWFVPYEIQLKSGGVKKHNLALKNLNQAQRWVLDGGL